MISCDYNGWTDAPEDEREFIDEFWGTAQPDERRSRAAGAPGRGRRSEPPRHERDAPF